MSSRDAVFSVQAVARRTVDLMNTLAGPDVGENARPGPVVEVLRRHGETGALELSPADLGDMAAAGRRLRAVFTATDTDTAARRLNELLAAVPAPPRLTSHEGRTTWHLHLDRDDDGPWGEWLLTSGALALAMLVTDQQHAPGGICAAADCDRVFLAHGRGGVRHYCSPRCATRARVAQHRRFRPKAHG